MNFLPNLVNNGFNKCELCVEAKHVKKKYFHPITKRKTKLLELIHTDLADFKNTENRGAKHHYFTFIDNFSRYSKIIFWEIKTRLSINSWFIKQKVENQLDYKIKRVRSVGVVNMEEISLKTFVKRGYNSWIGWPLCQSTKWYNRKLK